MDKRLAVFMNSFLLLQFLGLKCTKRFLKKMVLRVVFFFKKKMTFRWLQTCLPDLKNTKQLKLCLW